MDISLLLKQCEMSDEEMVTQKPRIERALQKSGIKDDDVKKAEANMERYYTSAGSRKAMGHWLKRYTDISLVHEDGKKFVYHVDPGMPRFNLVMQFVAGGPNGNIVCDFVDTVAVAVFGMTLFDKVSYFAQIAERNGMDEGIAHCGTQQTGLGCIVSGAIPSPDLIVGGGFHCDQGPKYCELLGERYGVPVFYVDSTRDENRGVFPDVVDENVKYLADSHRQFSKDVGDHLNIELPPELWKKARQEYGKLWFRIMQLQKIIVKADPRPINALDDIAVTFAALDPDWRLDEIHQCFDLVINDARERSEKGVGVMEKGAPKVNICSPPRADLVELFQEVGINVVIPGDYAWVAPWELGQPRKSGDDFDKIAESYIRKGYLRCGWDHTYRFAECAKVLALDGVIYGYYWACRVLTPPGTWTKDYVEKKLGLPCMSIEIDLLDPRLHTAEQQRTRVETFAGILKAHKKAREAKASASS